MKAGWRWFGFFSIAAAVTVLAWAGGAGTSPKPVLNVYFPTNLQDAAYQQAAFNKVAKAWKPAAPLPEAGKKTVVVATIDRAGKLTGTYFNLVSGSKPWDEAALAAVKAASPFPPLPQGVKESTVEVHWHFEVRR